MGNDIEPYRGRFLAMLPRPRIFKVINCMTTFLFRVSNTLVHAKQHMLLSAVVTVTMIVGLFYPCCILGAMNWNNQHYELSRTMAEQPFLYFDTLMPGMESEKIRNTIYDLPFTCDKIGVSATALRVPVTLNGKQFLGNLQGLEASILEVAARLVKGRLPTQQEYDQGASVALLTLSEYQRRNAHIGDTLEVNGKKLIIIGSVITSGPFGSILIPMTLMDTITQGIILQYQVYLWGCGEIDLQQAAVFLSSAFSGADQITVKSSEQLAAEDKRGFTTIQGMNIVQGLLTLAISLFSVVLILSGRVLQMRQVFAVKMSAGATRWQIVGDCCIESPLFALVALAVDLVLIYFFQNVVANICFVFFSIQLIATSLILSGVSAILVGAISGLIATHVSIAWMLNEIT